MSDRELTFVSDTEDYDWRRENNYDTVEVNDVNGLWVFDIRHRWPFTGTPR